MIGEMRQQKFDIGSVLWHKNKTNGVVLGHVVASPNEVQKYSRRSAEMKLSLKILFPVCLTVAILWPGVYSLAAEPPPQPILFSHKVHAGDYQIPCLYCHSYARRSIVAGVPSVRKCMGCHKITARDRPEIKKLHQYWNDKESIPWVRVYKLPDHAHFNHRRHVLKDVRCQECHGPVETMAEIKQVPSLEMGWCYRCHKKRDASVDCFTCHR